MKEARQNQPKEKSQDGRREGNMKEAIPVKTLQVPIINRMGARLDASGNLEVADQEQILNALTSKVSDTALGNAHQIKGLDQFRTTNLRLDRKSRRATLAKKNLRKTSGMRPEGDEKSRYHDKKVFK